MRAGRWVALPRALGEGSPDFASVSGNGELILGVQFDKADGVTERLAVGGEGEPFALTPDELEQAILAARAAR